jgi:O-antigen/teichoic acid export membrane protein
MSAPSVLSGAQPVAPVAAGGRRDLARSGAVSLVGAVFAAAGGFALTVLVGRLFGAHVAGLYYQAVAVFMILNGVALAGSDTGIVRSVSGHRAVGHHVRAFSAMRWTLTPVLLWSLVVALALGVSVEHVVATFPADDRPAVAAFLWVLVGTLVVSAVGQAALNGTRALGSVLPFVWLYQVALPVTRLLGVALLWLLDAPVEWLLLSYALPLVLLDVVATTLLVRGLARARRTAGETAPADAEVPVRAELRELWGFNLPRGVASCLELAIVWADVIIVGVLLGPAAAGAWAAASRFVTTGTMAMEALRLQSAPAMAAAWARGDREGYDEVYRVTAVWLVLVSWPLFLGLATWSPLVLGLVGPEFAEAAPALTLMALGMLAYVAMGNVNAALLMAGRSVVTAGNTAVALALNITLNLALVPWLGLMGAAIAWASCLTLDSALCLVRGRRLGLRLPVREVALAGAAALVAFGAPGLALHLLAAPTVAMLGLHVVGGLAVYAVLLHLLRRPLDLPDIRTLVRRPRPNRRNR